MCAESPKMCQMEAKRLSWNCPQKKDASIWIASAFATTQVLKTNSYFLCKFLSFPSQSFFPASQISSFSFSSTSDQKHKSNFPPVSLRCQAAFLRAFRIQPLKHHLSQHFPTPFLQKPTQPLPFWGRRKLRPPATGVACWSWAATASWVGRFVAWRCSEASPWPRWAVVERIPNRAIRSWTRWLAWGGWVGWVDGCGDVIVWFLPKNGWLFRQTLGIGS